MNHPIPNDEAERLEALHRLQILDTDTSAEFDAVVALAGAIFDAPVAMISFVDRDVQWFKARYGISERQTDRATAFCSYTILDNKILEIEDLGIDDRFRENPFVTCHPNIRYYIGVPISLDGKANIGTLCVLDTKPKKATHAQLLQLEQLKTVVVGLIRAHVTSIQAKLDAQMHANGQPCCPKLSAFPKLAHFL